MQKPQKMKKMKKTCKPNYSLNKLAVAVVILIIFFLPAGLISQIVIESADMPYPGDTIRISTGLNIDFIDYTETGEDFYWDFSDLIPLTQTVDTFVSPSETPFLYQFFFAAYSNLANRYIRDLPIPDFELTDVYFYYKNESSRFSNIGYAASVNGFPLPIRFDSPDVLYRFPLQYADTDSSFSHVVYSFPNMFYFLVERNRKNTVDGWGTITTPFGTFDVLRVKSEVHEFDSIYIDSIQMGIPINQNYIEYKWLAKGQKEPVLQVTENYVGGLFVFYRDSLRAGLNAINDHSFNGSTMAVYPNPAPSLFFAELSLLKPTDVELSVYDLSGKRLYIEQLNGMQAGLNRKLINLSHLELRNGMYVIKLSAGSQVLTKKLIIKNKH